MASIYETNALANAHILVGLCVRQWNRKLKRDIIFDIGRHDGHAVMLSLGNYDYFHSCEVDEFEGPNGRPRSPTAGKLAAMFSIMDPAPDGGEGMIPLSEEFLDLDFSFDIKDGQTIGFQWDDRTFVFAAPDDWAFLAWAERLEKLAQQLVGSAVVEMPPGLVEGGHRRPKH